MLHSGYRIPNRDRKEALPRNLSERSLEDARVGRRKRLPHLPTVFSLGVFITFGGPQAHGPSLEDVGL